MNRSTTDTDIPVQQRAIPLADSKLFARHGLARLAVGVLGVGPSTYSGLESEFHAYLRLRGAVYLQERYATEADLRPDGSEIDSDDERSVHIGVVENQPSEGIRMVGTMRLIVRRMADDGPLPIERHFPEVFGERPASAQSVEVSRLICGHEEVAMRGYCTWLLFAAGLTYVNANALGPVYGVVTGRLLRALRVMGVPAAELAEAKHIPEINARKLPILVDTGGLQSSIMGDSLRLGVFARLRTALTHDFAYVEPDAIPAGANKVHVVRRAGA